MLPIDNDEVEIYQPREYRLGDEIVYVVVPRAVRDLAKPPGMIICRRHLIEMREYLRREGPLHVRALGVREKLQSLEPHNCRMCEMHIALGNKCRNDRCALPLHPQWPAVYCCNDCALDDL